MSELAKSDDYRHWIVSIKSRVQASQIKAAVSVNRELMELYWFLGEQIIEKQVAAQWGDGFLKQMGKDLQAEFPEIRGFSIRNLQRMRRWVEFWSEDAQQGNKETRQSENRGILAQAQMHHSLCRNLIQMRHNLWRKYPGGTTA